MVKYRIGKSSLEDKAKSVHVFIDGRRVRKYVSLPHESRGRIAGVPTSENTRRPFIFADIQTTGMDYPRSQLFCYSYVLFCFPDEDVVPDDAHVKPDDIGIISVRVFLVQNWKQRDASSPGEYKVQDHPPVMINERAKKAGEHCVS